MAYESWKERKRIAAALKAIYQAENADRGHFPHDDAARKLIYLAAQVLLGVGDLVGGQVTAKVGAEQSGYADIIGGDVHALGCEARLS